ncbi:MAG TPA: hypothetical protein VN414_10755 [Methanosarcina sp.]|nr:hypothetical protein [Methanosarcina sp.]
MAKKPTTGDSLKAGASGGKPQAKASANKSSKKDVKPSKPEKKEK